jgi:NAD(P)H-flavin reductase
VVRIRFDGASYDCAEGESVLDVLLRNGTDPSYSCRLGVCLTCVLRAVEGPVPAAAQEGLRPTLREQGYFLPCVCQPTGDLEVVPAEDAAVFGRARVVAVEPLAPRVCRVRLEPANELYYHAGQFLNLRRRDRVTRSYSLASVPSLDRLLEVHVKRLPGGRMSNWIFDELRPGDGLDLQGPNGACYYLPGKPEQPLLLIGNGTGLAPLIGIARDALASGHRGEIRLYHGSRHAEGLYLVDELRRLERDHANFSYHPCLSGDGPGQDCRAARADVAAFADLPELGGWRVFLCGYPPMVNAARRDAYLAGAALADIHADPFELRELRRKPRD